MIFTLSIGLLVCGLLLGVVLLLEVGRRIALRQKSQHGEAASDGFSALDGAIFGLLGLLIAFTFSGAASRFDARRHLIVEEANAIGTAYLRLDTLPADTQPALRESFRRYMDARLDVYRKLPDLAASREALARAAELQGEIWRQAVAGCRASPMPQVMSVVLPALNDMIDITTTRSMAAQMHPPTIIFVMLFGLVLIGSLLAGYGMAKGKARSWLHMLALAATMALSIYVILDLEFPRLGLIRVDTFDQVLVDLRESMK